MNSINQNNQPVVYHRFAPPQPFLIDPPREYLHRIANACQTILIQPEETSLLDPVKPHAVITPAIAYPIPLVYPDEHTRINPQAADYPLMRPPTNHQPDGTSVYWLTLILYHALENNLASSHEDLNAINKTTPYQADEQKWDLAAQTANELTPLLTVTNLNRLIRFSHNQPEEQATLQRLWDWWNITNTRDQILDATQAVADCETMLNQMGYHVNTETVVDDFVLACR